jgi:hypothetical protein
LAEWQELGRKWLSITTIGRQHYGRWTVGCEIMPFTDGNWDGDTVLNWYMNAVLNVIVLDVTAWTVCSHLHSIDYAAIADLKIFKG